MEIAIFWCLFAIAVGVAANARGRDGVGWFLLALIHIATSCIVVGSCHAERRIARRSAATVYGPRSVARLESGNSNTARRGSVPTAQSSSSRRLSFVSIATGT
jgi:hypothetical protein